MHITYKNPFNTPLSKPGIRFDRTPNFFRPHYHDITWAPLCLKLHYMFDSLLSLTTKKTSKFHVTVCEGNPPVTVGIPSQRGSNVESVSMSWRLNEVLIPGTHSMEGSDGSMKQPCSSRTENWPSNPSILTISICQQPLPLDLYCRNFAALFMSIITRGGRKVEFVEYLFLSTRPSENMFSFGADFYGRQYHGYCCHYHCFFSVPDVTMIATLTSTYFASMAHI